MSTIKVNAIKNTSTDDGGIAIDNSGHVQIDGQQLPTTGALSNRNLIINGAMQVAQRGTSFTSNGYTLDRWRFSTNAGAFTVSQSSTAPAGFTNSLKVDCTTTGTPTGQDEGYVETKIEAQNLQHLQFGTSGAQPVTLSFYVKSNKTGSYGLWTYQEDAASQYATTYTISSADTWEHKTITIPGNTATAINNDNGVGLDFRFYLLAGSDYAGTPAETWTTTLTSNRTTSLNLADNTANEWLITGVQLEVGEKATPFEYRSYGDELQRCERYCQQWKGDNTPSTQNVICGASGINSTNSACFLVPSPKMRGPFSVSFADIIISDSATYDADVSSMGLTNASADGAYVTAQHASNGALSDAQSLRVKGGTNGYLRLEAEL